MQITAEQQPASTESKECVCEMSSKRGNKPCHVTGMSYCLLALTEPCNTAETPVKLAELGLGGPCF